MVFQVNKNGHFFYAKVLLSIVVAYYFVTLFSPTTQITLPLLLGTVFLLLIAAVYLTSFILVKAITITDEQIIFSPVNFRIDLSAIDQIENVTYRDVKSMKLVLRLNKQSKFKWIPGSLMLAEKRAYINIYCVDGEALVKKIEATLLRE